MSFFLWIGTTFAFFTFRWQNLKIILRGLQMELSHNLSMRILIISLPWSLFESSLLIMFLISSTKKSTSEDDFFGIKGKSDGIVLLLSINKHCFAKKELKISLFSLKSVINLLSWKSGGIQGIFLPFKRVFNRVQKHLGLVGGSDNFFEIFLQFLNWKKLI